MLLSVFFLTLCGLAGGICSVWSKFDFKIRRDRLKKSNKSHVYESVDDRSLSKE